MSQAPGAGALTRPGLYVSCRPSFAPTLCSREGQSRRLRPREALRGSSERGTNAQIVRVLYSSEGTARNHLCTILRKPGLRDRTGLAIFPIERGAGDPCRCDGRDVDPALNALRHVVGWWGARGARLRHTS